MNTVVLKGVFTLGAADFSRKALLAATMLLCARFLSPGEFGEYAFLLSFYQIFSVLGGAGFPNCLLRTAARNQCSGMRVGLASVLARLLYIAPTALLMYAAMRLFGFSDKYFPAIGLLALMMVVRGSAENVSFIFQGHEDRISCAKIGLSQSAVTLSATAAICLTSKSLLLLVGAHVLGGFVSAAYGFALMRSKGWQGKGPDLSIFGQVRSLLRESHWLNASAFVASAYNRVDVLLLRRLLTSEAVAVYAAPYRILDLTQVVPSSLMATILPGLCRNDDVTSGITLPRAAMRFLLVIALCMIVTVTVAAPWITLLLFGPNYRGSIPVLRVLIWATLPMFWSFVLNAQLIANSFDRAILYAASSALAVNVGFNLLLIPKFGYLGCTVVTLVTEFVLLGTNLIFISKIGAVAWPEQFGRLGLTSVLVAGFCFSWTIGASDHSLLSAVLLVLSALSLPVSWSDFSTSGLQARSRAAAPVTRIIS